MFLSFVFLSLLQIAISFEPCLTPNGAHGSCVLLKQCSPLFSHFERGIISPRNRKLLRRSHCGFFDSHPKVCCPNSDESLPGAKSFPSTQLDQEICGSYDAGKIVGGEKARIDEFPWTALLEFKIDGNVTYECGGSLINKRYVLTAAHCLLDSLVNVRLGEYNTQTDPDCVKNLFGEECAPPVQNFGIESKIAYKSYDPQDSTKYHDIGLIRLDRDVKYSDFIKPICLPLSADEVYNTYAGMKLIVTGWGRTEHEVKSNIKLKVQVPVRELSFCEQNYQRLKVNLSLDSGHLCAGGVKDQDSCKGDSGGPLMDFKFDPNHDLRFYVVGIVSFGPNPCGQEKLPGIYTRVSKYVSWILGNLRP